MRWKCKQVPGTRTGSLVVEKAPESVQMELNRPIRVQSNINIDFTIYIGGLRDRNDIYGGLRDLWMINWGQRK